VGVVEDLSNYGACLRLEQDLPLHQQVVIFIGEIFRLCTVRHCQREEDGWRIGVAFCEPWPESVQTPIYRSELLGVDRIAVRGSVE
jgi:hypothetical protein